MLRPFNFYINPVPEKKFDVERDVTFQSGGMFAHESLKNQY